MATIRQGVFITSYGFLSNCTEKLKIHFTGDMTSGSYHSTGQRRARTKICHLRLCYFV